MTDIVDPHDLDTERAILGAIMIANEHLDAVASEIGASDFYRAEHRAVYREMLRLWERREPIDYATLRAALANSGALENVGQAYLAALVDGVPRASNVTAYARIVRGHARARTVNTYCRQAIATFSADPSALANGAGARFAEAIHREVEGSHSVDEASGSESLVDFLADTTAPAPEYIEDFAPSSGILLANGQPRARKSWIVLAAGLSLALKRAPFGLSRLKVAEPVAVTWCTQEDPRIEVRKRIREILAGLGESEIPTHFRLFVHRGVSLDDPSWQARLMLDARKHGTKVLVVDPLRSMTACADQGPKELKPLQEYLRTYMRETGATVWLPHHDTKLRADGKPDDRPRAQRASGGGIFSIADAPVAIERLDDHSSLVVPNLWKFRPDPPAFRVRFESGDGYIRLTGEDIESDNVATFALQERVLAEVMGKPGMSGSQVQTAVKARKDDVYTALETLATAGKLDSVKKGRAIHWFPAAGN